MSIMGIIIAAAVVGAVGLVIGVLLGVASEKFKVEVDEKEILVRNELPGNNCGGCGYPGCDGLAKAIAAGEAAVDACPVGGAPVGAKIAARKPEAQKSRWPLSNVREPVTRPICSTAIMESTTAARFPWFPARVRKPVLTAVWVTGPV